MLTRGKKQFLTIFLLGCILSQLEVGYHSSLVARGNKWRIPPMIAMPVRYEHIICFDILWFDFTERIVPEIRIDRQAMSVGSDFETGMTVKSDLYHATLSPIL